MAKEPTKTGSAAALAADLLAAFGPNAGASSVENFIDTGSPELNEYISGRPDGGLPMGRCVEMFGPSSAGKTALASQWMIEAQHQCGVAGFTDWERSFSEEMAVTMGLNNQRPYWLYNKAKTWEEGNIKAAQAVRLIRGSGAIPKDAPILWVFDSIASAIPQSVMYDKNGELREMDTLTMNDTTALARVASTTLKVMAQVAAEYNATFLYLNQIRTKPGVMFGDPTTTPGGVAMEFYSTARLSLSREKIFRTVNKEKIFVGQDIKVKVVKSKMTQPFRVAEQRMEFNERGNLQFNMAYSTIEMLIARGKITKEGTWLTYPVDGQKYQGSAALAKHINEKGLQKELAKFACS